jgi:hypothetical protein
MSPGSYIDHLLWVAIVPDLEFNPDAAIYKFWRELRNDPATMNPGLPCTKETETEAGVQQGFSGGIVLGWNETDGAYIANG